MGDLLNGHETELKECGFRRLPKVFIGGGKLNVVMAHCCSGDELRIWTSFPYNHDIQNYNANTTTASLA
ncbi:hypothetical protein YC2023_008488 [Brassica napus]